MKMWLKMYATGPKLNRSARLQMGLSVAGLLMMVAGCDHSDRRNSNTSSLAGNIVIEGSSTVEPISIKATEQFNALHPRVNVSVSGKGTGNGIAALTKGEADIACCSRPIKEEELTRLVEAGVAFYELPVAYDGLTIAVNKNNSFVDQLTVEQLTKIFREDLAAKTWNEINPAWPKERISAYAAGIASGTHDYLVEIIGKSDNQGMRSDEQITLSEDDKLLVRGIKEDKHSIGFFGYGYFLPEKNSLRAVKIVNDQGLAIEPSIETISSGAYSPFSRPLFIYVNAQSYRRTEVNEFVSFYLTHAVKIAEQAGYVPLPEELYLRAFDRLDGVDGDGTGTHFLKEHSQSRTRNLADRYVLENLRKQ